MLASGSGATSRGVMGTAVVFGMSIATLVGICLIPICYVFVQGFAELGKNPVKAGIRKEPELPRFIEKLLQRSRPAAT